MNFVISIVLPILLLVVALFYLSHFYSRQLRFFKDDITFKKTIKYIGIILMKSIIPFVLIIFIHNSFHGSHLLELTLFMLVFLLYSILQSSFSISGFLNRNKQAYTSFVDYFSLSSKLIQKVIDSIDDRSFFQATLLAKILVVIVFTVIFIPNVSFYITTNVLFIILILLILIVSLLLNNVIYFGLISLMIFQYHGEAVTFDSLNLIVLTSAFLVLAMGSFVETRLVRRMFIPIKLLPVKSLNFSLGYEIVLYRRELVIYQNIINHYYYVYYRKLGLVTVFYSEFDPKVSKIVLNRMIRYGSHIIKSQYIDIK